VRRGWGRRPRRRRQLRFLLPPPVRVEQEAPSDRDPLREDSGAARAQQKFSSAARAFLLEFLAGGPVPARAVATAARAKGISPITLKRARRDLGIEARKSSFGGGWLVSLPDRPEVDHGETGEEDQSRNRDRNRRA